MRRRVARVMVFVLLARRSTTLWPAMVCGPISLFYLWDHRSWLGNWQGGVQDATSTLSLILPGVVLAAGLDARRYLRSREVGLVSGTRPIRALATAVGASAVWPALVMVTLILTTFAINAGISEFHHPGVLPLVLPFVFILGYTAWGYLCGRFLDVVSLVPVAAVTGFLAPALLAYMPDVRKALLTPVDNAPSSPPMFLRAESVAAQVGIGAAVVLGIMAVLLVDGRAVRWVVRLQATAVTVTVAVVAAILAVANPDRHYVATDASGPRACRTSASLEVCVWPDHSPLLSPTLRVGARLATALGDSWAERPVGLMEAGLHAPDGWAPFSTGTTYAADADLAYSLAAVFVAMLACGPGGRDPELSEDVTDREQWLLVSAGYLPEQFATERVQRIRARPPERQRGWWAGFQEGSVPCR
jgi:hypothetical protein